MNTLSSIWGRLPNPSVSLRWRCLKSAGRIYAALRTLTMNSGKWFPNPNDTPKIISIDEQFGIINKQSTQLQKIIISIGTFLFQYRVCHATASTVSSLPLKKSSTSLPLKECCSMVCLAAVIRCWKR